MVDVIVVVVVAVFSFRETCSLSKKRKTKREMLSEKRIHEEYAKLGPIRCVIITVCVCVWFLCPSFPDLMSLESLRLYSWEYGQFLWGLLVVRW